MKQPPPTSAALAGRVVEIRVEIFGEGRSESMAMAAELSLHPRTWENYEAGVTMPAAVMLGFLVATGANPRWLMDGTGERYVQRPGGCRGHSRGGNGSGGPEG